MPKDPSRPGRPPGSVSGDRNRTDYSRQKDSENISFSTNRFDREVMERHRRETGLQGTDFLRAATHGYDNRFQWDKAQGEISQLIEEQFERFVERFGTAAEHERNLLQENQSKAAALTMLLYKFHLLTVHITALLDHVQTHPPFAADNACMLALKGNFTGPWKDLHEAILRRLFDGDERLLKIIDLIGGTMPELSDAIFNIFDDISPLYNSAVANAAVDAGLTYRKARYEAFKRLTNQND